MLRRVIVVAAVVVLSLATGFVTLAYPAIFRESLAEPWLQLDAAEGRVGLDSQIVIEVRGSFSEEEIRESLDIRPPLPIGEDDLTVKRVAVFPWHEGFPWAKTRVTINPAKARLFQPETSYAIALKDQLLTFDTISLPRVVAAHITPAVDDVSGSVPTSSSIVLRFNEELIWQDEWLSVDPPADVTTTTRKTEAGGTEVVVKAEDRWENSTTYTVTVPEGVIDVHGHEGEEPFSLDFITGSRPVVVGATPTGNHLSPESAVRVEFDRAMNRQSVEESLLLQPGATGIFEWEGDLAFEWRPAALEYSTAYTVSLGGTSIDGDPLVPHKWSFSTHDPPIQLAIEGEETSPATLGAAVSGGTGEYSFEWSSGETSREIRVDLWFEEVRTYAVSVTSGDRSASAEFVVSGPPSPCPEEWRIINEEVCYNEEVLPGPVQVFTARVDLRDPDVGLSSLPAGDFLGQARTVSESSQPRDAVVAVNGDFFNISGPEHFTLGPMISGSSFVRAPQSGGVVLALDGALNSWVGPAQTLEVYVQPPDGDPHRLNSVNTAPGEDQLVLFNAYRASQLAVAADACYATFAPADDGASGAYAFSCGATTEVRLQVGEFVLVGRGAAADWLRQYVDQPLGFVISFALPDVEFLVGGSHVLISNGEPTEPIEGKRHPRTAIGVDAERYLYLVVVDGRSDESIGMTLAELQGYLAGFDLVSAINLDGGGSSTLVLEGAVMNTPSDGKERTVASVVVVQLAQSPEACWHRFIRCN